ncbi:MAG: substrate-binding and VWA domain-containing protein [Caldilineales bacterium]
MAKKTTPIGPWIVVATVIVGFFCIFGCVLALIAFNGRDSGSGGVVVADADPATATLTLAYSAEKAALITDLVDRFNQQKLRTDDRKTMEVQLLELAPDLMVEEALSDAPRFQALTPDSSLWLDQLDRRWAEQQQLSEGAIAPSAIGEAVRYAISPVVIAMWDDVARSLGWPDQPVGWETIQQRAASDPDFRWSHPSTSQASGLLATLAEFYAGAGKTRGLTVEDATAQDTIDYVADVERTVKFYGEGETAILDRIKAEGRNFLDAFVVQEHLVVNYNRDAGSGSPELVAVYPAEGTLWADHPLALLESSALTNNQRSTFRAFRDYVQSPEAQQIVLQAGFRPADLSLSLAGGAVSPANGADPSQPQTTLQVPGPAVVDVVQNVWQFTKRKANIYLVVDTSGSMEGEKLAAAQAALREFLDQIKGEEERVGLVEFSTFVNNIDPLDTMANNRAHLERSIDNLEAGGDTALLDAIMVAYDRIQQDPDPERINAIVAMTDGRENASSTTLLRLRETIRRGNSNGVPVVVFTIAFGDDADYDVLQTIADASGGQMRQGDLETIRQLYRILSSYF